MCWVAYNKKEATVNIAKEDIIVYKIVRMKGNKLYPYFYHFNNIYTINKVNPLINIELEESLEETHYACINKGYHSYAMIPEIYKYKFSDDDVIFVNYNTKYKFLRDTYELDDPLCLVECIIPKGTKYYVNHLGECVSEQLIVTKILEEYGKT